MMIAFACRRGRNGVLRRVYLASMIGFAVATTAWAQVPGSIRDYALPAASLTQSINAIGQNNGVQVIYDAALLQGKMTGPISGHFTLGQALDRALARSGLTYELVNSGRTVVIRKAPPPQENNSTAPNNKSTKAKEDAEPTRLSAVTVTGTRIRGGSSPSPVITIGSEQIQAEGFTDLGQVIRSVPQNFNGGQNPGVAVGATAGAGANQNFTGGSALNLRGLGPDATLTLLNGRRLAYDGPFQAVDISAIPIDAVDRVEIVPDGASAIYGSDAVGGVANVILKRDYDGLTVGARYGGATEGGLATREYTLTGGTQWSSGGLIATYKDVSTDPIYARQRDYTGYMFDPTTLFPGSDLRSGLVSLHQSIGDSVELRLDALRTRRRQDIYQFNTSLLPYYNRVTPETTTSLVSPNVEISLAGDWTLSVGGSWGRDSHDQHRFRIDKATGVPTTLIHECYCNDARSYEVSAEGLLFAMAGGDARLAIGIGGRRNEFVQDDYLADTNYAEGDESSRFAYAEASFPLVGPDSDVAGVRRLDLSVAVRGEDYDSFGSVTTPKLGLIYGPNNDFTLKASWGKSFKAPTLLQLHQIQISELDPASLFGGAGYGPNATVLSLWGGDPDLGAERATTWTVSSAFHPEALPALEAELTWFDIDYTDRVVFPIADYGHALGNPNTAQFINYSPTVKDMDELMASAHGGFYNYTGKPYDPNDVVATMYANFVNAARQHVKGLDLSSSYRFDFGPGHLTLRGSVTWLDSTQQTTSSQDAYDIAGTIFNPAKVKGRFGAIWNRGGFLASAFVNYTGGVTDTANGWKGASFTTLDATLRYATDESFGALSGLEFALSAQNMLNRDPPFYASATLDRPPYDSTNYSAIGRFVSLSVSKHW